MKTKLHLTTMMFLLMALAMSAQPLSVTTKAQPKIHVCNETKIEFKKGKMVSQPIKKVNKDASENKQYCFSYYNPQQSLRLNEDESTNSATVTFIYNLQEQELGTYYVASVMVYNPDWSESWDPDFYDPEDGSPVTGIIVNVPYGTYDIITDTYEQIDPYSNYKHIDELVTIDKDTTIYLNVLNAENKVSWNIYNNNNELFVPKTIRLIDQEPWYEVIDEGNLFNARGLAFLRLDGYGDVHTLNFGYDATPEGSTNPIYYYINELSDRYNFVIMEEEAGNDGMLYVNKLTSNGPNPFPLNNDASAYIAYEEQIQRTPKGINTVQTPLTQLSTYTYLDNSWEWSDDLLSNKAIGEDCIARVMINTTKNNGENLQGVNVGIAVGVIDYESWDVEEYEYEDENGNIVTQVDSTLNAEYIVGPKLMVNDDKSIEFLVHFDVTKSPEIGIWLDDYPAHPKFSYTSEQKKGIVGNSCPLNAIDAQNGWNQWYNANMINLLRLTQHRGRNGEYISSGKGDQNSLEYETAYNKLLNQVKDKSHDDKVKFLLPHIDELREIVDMWSTTNDMNHPLCRPSRDGDEVLAHLIVYRYENHIGVLEDFDHEFTKDYIELINWEVEAKYADEDVKEILKYEEEHPEEMVRRHKENMEFFENMDDTPLLEKHPMEYWLNYGKLNRTSEYWLNKSKKEN